MAVTKANGVEHVFAPNPRLQGEEWTREFPPLETDADFLQNKFTGEIVPNQPDFAARSDILEPYYPPVETATPTKAKRVKTGELDEL